MPLFQLQLFIVYQAPHSPALAPSCGVLVPKRYRVPICSSADTLSLCKVHSVPNDKILDWSKLKAFADDKLNEIEKLEFVLEWVEKMVGEGENAGFQHFLLFSPCFQKASLVGVVKVGIMW